MTQRQALREYQSYLADRLKQAQSAPSSVSWLGVGVDGQRFLLPLGDTAEIIHALPVQPIAHVQPWLLGVANWRGAVVTVIDWGLWWAAQGPSRSGATTDGAVTPKAVQRRWMVALNPALDMPCMLALDDTFGLHALPADALQAVQATGEDALYTHTHGGSAADAWTVVNLKALCRLPAFLTISRSPSAPEEH